MSYTLGPWSVWDGDGVAIVETPDAGVRFTVQGGNQQTDWANARLIAAAPELLDAAIYALKCLDAANRVLGGWASTEYYVEARNDLKKAIAKAEGKDE